MFTKALFESRKLLGAAQDGSRKWVTVVTTICADGTSLSPGLIYEGQPNTIQDTWLEGVSEEEHLAFLTSSANGWTNDELGFDWLVNLFDRETRAKAKRDWRLLFLDGHGSHLTTPIPRLVSVEQDTGRYISSSLDAQIAAIGSQSVRPASHVLQPRSG